MTGRNGEEGYELVEIISYEGPPPPPARLEEMYEVPFSPPPAPSQLLPLSLSLTTGAEEDNVHDVIPGEE